MLKIFQHLKEISFKGVSTQHRLYRGDQNRAEEEYTLGTIDLILLQGHYRSVVSLSELVFVPLTRCTLWV